MCRSSSPSNDVAFRRRRSGCRTDPPLVFEEAVATVWTCHQAPSTGRESEEVTVRRTSPHTADDRARRTPRPAAATGRAGFPHAAYGYFSARARVLRRRGDVAVRPADDSSSVRHGGRSSSC